MKTSAINRRYYLIIASIIGISLLHYLTPLHLHMLHDIFQRLYYVPIIFAAFWFGFWGGIICALIISLVYAPHILFQWGGHLSMELEKYLEIILFNIVGGVTGFLSEQEKKYRKRLQKTSSGLEESLHMQQIQAERIIEIEEQLRKAERLSTVGELAAIMAHEIRNPLSSIKGTAEILKDDFRPGERKYEFLEILVKESNRLNHFVEDFLRLAKPQAITPGRCNIMELLNTIVTLVAAEAKSRNVRIEFKPVTLPVIGGDEDKLRQAFLNIVLNSLQAAPKGGTVIISATLEGRDGATNRWMNICFTDNGTGVTPEVRQHLFKPFFTTKTEGVGLGLVITKRIVEGHGGAVELKSVPGEGTTFCIRLPLTPEGGDVHGTENPHNR